MKIVCHRRQASLYGNLLVSSEVSLFCSLIVRKGILSLCLFGLHRILVIILVNSDNFCISRTRPLEDKWPQAQIPGLYTPSILWKKQICQAEMCLYWDTLYFPPFFFFSLISTILSIDTISYSCNISTLSYLQYIGRNSLSSVQSLSRVQLFAIPWIAAHQAFLSITNSRSLPKLMFIESVMTSNHLILCHPLLLLPSTFPSIRVFSTESALHIRWPKYWSFSFSISPSNEYSGLISFRTDWLDLFAVQGTLKSLLQHHSSKASILRRSAL